jgi:hypothetical protein
MLSARGRQYAALDLAAGYTKVRGPLYNKDTHPDGLVSFKNAENVSERHVEYYKLIRSSADVCNSFSCMMKRLTISRQRSAFTDTMVYGT